MIRPSLDDIPDEPLPAGLELRPVTTDQYRAIWEAGDETSGDEWGYVPPTEDDYQAWLKDTTRFQPHLWQVAWDTASNQVADSLHTFIDHAENEKYGRKRGYTEGLGVRPLWRR